MDERTVLQRFGLPVSAVIPVNGGTVARVWRVDTTGDSYLLRTLTDREQGEREQAIVSHLYSRGFIQTPEIVAMAEQDGIWYQLQRYWEGSMPDPTRSGVPEVMARTVAEYQAALIDCPAVEGGADRFDLAEAWVTYGANWSALETSLTWEQANEEVAWACTISDRERCVIHGDLGPWNMLWRPEGRILIIDFGEARMGDPYFDLASVLGGLMNHTPADQRRRVCTEFFNGYEAIRPVDRDRLLEQLALWSWRGLAQWCGRAAAYPETGKKMAARFLAALEWAKENLYEL